MKTSELIGAQLDWAVAKCEGDEPCKLGGSGLSYSTDWLSGGPIIEREKISLDQCYDTHLLALSSDCRTYSLGATPLIAAMRCYVASKLGEEVEVPDELKGE